MWTRPLLVAVIVIVYVRLVVRRVVVTVSVDEPVPVTVVWLKLIVSPFAPGEMLDARVTVPVKPLSAVTVTP